MDADLARAFTVLRFDFFRCSTAVVALEFVSVDGCVKGGVAVIGRGLH